MSGIIEEFKPDELAIEAPFYGKNVQSMLKLGRAQGVAMVAALQYQVPITEYVPQRIKQAITGTGTASKEQVAGMLQRYFKIANEQMPQDLDATDGLAVALCHHFMTSSRVARSAQERLRIGLTSFVRTLTAFANHNFVLMPIKRILFYMLIVFAFCPTSVGGRR